MPIHLPAHFPRSAPLTRLSSAMHVALAGIALSITATPLLAAEQAGTAAAQTSTSATQQYAIAAGSLGDVLAQYAASLGVQLAFDPAILAGLRSNGLQGRYTLQQGFDQLLRGSGYQTVAKGKNSFALQKAPLAPKTKSDTIATLPDVNVAATMLAGELPKVYAGGQVARGGQLGMLGNKDVMDTPFNITSYTETLARDQQAQTIGDVLLNDPSVRSNTGTGGEYENFTIRGFAVNGGDMALNGMYGIAPDYTTFTEFAERVEVIKGPTALLTGMAPGGSIGGGINLVTKRAADTPLTRVSARYTSDSQYGTHVDIGRRFGENNAWGIRVNGVYRDGNGAIDRLKQENSLGSLALDYRGERLRASFDYIYQSINLNGHPQPLYIESGIGLDIPSAPDGKTNYARRWQFSDQSNRSALANVEYDLSDNLQLYSRLGSGRSRWKTTVSEPSLLNTAGDISTGITQQTYNWDKTSVEAGLRGQLDTGAVHHEATVSTTLYKDEVRLFYDNTAGQDSNIYHPVSAAEPVLADRGSPIKTSASLLTSVAVADTLSILQKRVQLTLGARRQQVRSDSYDYPSGDKQPSYNETAVTPVAGLVIKPWQQVSLYANYIQGLQQGGNAPLGTGLSNAGQVFAPFKSKQYEAGIKMDHGRFTTTLSVFQIAQPSGVVADNTYSINGEQRNRGVELNVFGQVVDGVRLLGGIAMNDAKLTKTEDGLNQGNRPVGIPEVQANLNGEWDAPFLPGVTLTTAAIYTGSQYNDQDNLQKLPDWTRIDMGARYATLIRNTPAVFRLNVRNVFDREYWAGATGWGAIYAGAPRTVLLSATLDF